MARTHPPSSLVMLKSPYHDLRHFTEFRSIERDTTSKSLKATSFPHHNLTWWHHKKKYSRTNSRHKYQRNVWQHIKTSISFCSTIILIQLSFSHSRSSQITKNITQRYKKILFSVIIAAKFSHPPIPQVYLYANFQNPVKSSAEVWIHFTGQC